MLRQVIVPLINFPYAAIMDLLTNTNEYFKRSTTITATGTRSTTTTAAATTTATSVSIITTATTIKAVLAAVNE